MEFGCIGQLGLLDVCQIFSHTQIDCHFHRGTSHAVEVRSHALVELSLDVSWSEEGQGSQSIRVDTGVQRLLSEN